MFKLICSRIVCAEADARTKVSPVLSSPSFSTIDPLIRLFCILQTIVALTRRNLVKMSQILEFEVMPPFSSFWFQLTRNDFRIYSVCARKSVNPCPQVVIILIGKLFLYADSVDTAKFDRRKNTLYYVRIDLKASPTTRKIA